LNLEHPDRNQHWAGIAKDAGTYTLYRKTIDV
jgi:hypothetical protein